MTQRTRRVWWCVFVASVLWLAAPVEAQTTRYVCNSPSAGACAAGSPGYSTLSAAYSAAAAGDTIRLTAGETHTGSTTLTLKSGCTTWDCIIITTTATSGDLPPAADRPCPTGLDGDLLDQCTPNVDLALYPRLQGTQTAGFDNDPIIYISQGAIGITIDKVLLTNNYRGGGVSIRIGSGDAVQNMRAEQPAFIKVNQVVFDYRTYHPYWGQRRAIEIHAKDTAITRNYMEWANQPGASADASPIWCHNGEGPWTIEDNWISGGTYSFMCGGERFSIWTQGVITGTPTSTSATLNWSAGLNTEGDCPFVGQRVAIRVNSAASLVYPVVTGVSNCTATSADITFAAVSGTIDVPGDFRFGMVPGDNAARVGGATDGITVRYNTFFRNPVWRSNPIIPSPSGFAVSDTSGDLASGTYSCRAIARITAQGDIVVSAPTAAQDVVVTTGGISWSVTSLHSDIAYRVFCTNSGGTSYFWDFGVGATSGTITVITPTNTGTPAATGTAWRFRFGFEIKAAMDLLFEGNVVWNIWTGATGGAASILIKTTVQGGTNSTNTPWLETRSPRIYNNVVRSGARVFAASCIEYDNSGNNILFRPFGVTGLHVKNLLYYDMSTTLYGGSGTTGFYLAAGCSNTTIEHVTGDQTSGFTLEPDGHISTSRYLSNGFVFKNNLLTRASSAIKASGFTEGIISLDSTEGVNAAGGGTYDVTYNVWGNQVSGPTSGWYPNQGVTSPVGNVFTAYATWQALFTAGTSNTIAGYKLADGSPYATAASDGTALGVQDIDALNLLALRALSGIGEIDEEEPPVVDDDPFGPGPTRFYLSRVAAEVTPTVSTGFNRTGSLAWFRTDSAPSGSIMAERPVSVGTATNPETHALAGFVSRRLLAQVISGTVACQVRGRTNNVDHHPTPALAIYLVDELATTIKATLLAPVASDTLASPPAFLASGSINRNRSCLDAADATDIALTQATSVEGDRLLFVLGAKDHSTSSASVTIVVGDDASTDLDPADTGSTPNNPWVEIEDGIRFVDPDMGGPLPLSRLGIRLTTN